MSGATTVANIATWEDPAWRTTAASWIDEQAERLGLRRIGQIEQAHARQWSLMWRITTADGLVWFKANGGDTRYEAPLAEALGRWAPGRVLAPLAVQAERGWQLLPDGEARCATTLPATLPNGPVASFATVPNGPLASFATVPNVPLASFATIKHALGELRGMGGRSAASTRSAPLALDLMPQPTVVALAADPPPARDAGRRPVAELVDDPATGLSPESRARIRALLPEYGQWCARLGDSGIPSSLNHDDLHDANVFVGPDGFVFFDWGDSAMCHPFTTLLVALRVVAYRFELPADDRSVLRVRDAYLEVFDDLADVAQLRELARLATWTGKPARAMSWRRALAGASEADWPSTATRSSAGWRALEPGPL